jgi:hypothetical protein
MSPTAKPLPLDLLLEAETILAAEAKRRKAIELAYLTFFPFVVAVTALKDNVVDQNRESLVEFIVHPLSADFHALTEVKPETLEYVRRQLEGMGYLVQASTYNKSAGMRHNVLIISPRGQRHHQNIVAAHDVIIKMARKVGEGPIHTFYAPKVTSDTLNFFCYHLPGSTKSASKKLRAQQALTTVKSCAASVDSSAAFIAFGDSNADQMSCTYEDGSIGWLKQSLSKEGIEMGQAGEQGRRKSNIGEYCLFARGVDILSNHTLTINAPDWHSDHKTTGIFVVAVKEASDELAPVAPSTKSTSQPTETTVTPKTPAPASPPVRVRVPSATTPDTTQIPTAHIAPSEPTTNNASMTLSAQELGKEIDRLRAKGVSLGSISMMAGYSGSNGGRDIKTFLRHVANGEGQGRLKLFMERLRENTRAGMSGQRA